MASSKETLLRWITRFEREVARFPEFLPSITYIPGEMNREPCGPMMQFFQLTRDGDGVRVRIEDGLQSSAPKNGVWLTNSDAISLTADSINAFNRFQCLALEFVPVLANAGVKLADGPAANAAGQIGWWALNRSVEANQSAERFHLNAFTVVALAIERFIQTLGDSDGKAKIKGKGRRRKLSNTLTPKEAETLAIVNECGLNFQAAADKLGKDRKTVSNAYYRAYEKMGEAPPKIRRKNSPLPEDERGNSMVESDGKVHRNPRKMKRRNE